MKNEYCFLISAMRSGSTLLKALIATRPDCSDLPEKSFSKNYENIKSDKRIILLKQPAGYIDLDYPYIDSSSDTKKIILIRNPHDTIYSLYNMNKETGKENANYNDPVYLISYWYTIYHNIIIKKILESENSMLVRYEDLINNPIAQTENIFKFIGTDFTEGTDTYLAPANYEWKWGSDDGGEVIKTLKVQKSTSKQKDEDMLNYIKNNDKLQFVLSYFGYNDPGRYDY